MLILKRCLGIFSFLRLIYIYKMALRILSSGSIMKRIWGSIDWVLAVATLPLFLAGLITMKSLGALSMVSGIGGDYFFSHQLIWIAIGIVVFFAASLIDWRFLRNGWILFWLYILGVATLLSLLFFANIFRGTQSWIRLGIFSLEPAEPMKLILILVLAKYFSRRHVEIKHIKHIFVSGIYALIPAVLIFLQPDLGSALIFASIWLGMILVSGVSKKHLFGVFLTGAVVFLIGWFFLLAPYQKSRLVTFINPLRDPRGAGYNALQSKIAVGSGGLWGRGVGYGTQSRLQFLPEYETDFIFAAFAEEWGFLGVLFLFIFFGAVFWRILKSARSGQTNFEKLTALGIIFMLVSHFAIHIGMNVGLLPVTGITLPFLSYGGSHVLTVLASLGLLEGMRRYGYKSGHSRMDEELALADVFNT